MDYKIIFKGLSKKFYFLTKQEKKPTSVVNYKQSSQFALLNLYELLYKITKK